MGVAFGIESHLFLHIGLIVAPEGYLIWMFILVSPIHFIDVVNLVTISITT